MSRQHPGESYRHAIDARRPSAYGGGTCTVLVRRIDGRVELLFHACPETGAIMTPAQAVEIAAALTEAAENRCNLHWRPDAAAAQIVSPAQLCGLLISDPKPCNSTRT